MPDDTSADPIERWTAKRRATLVLSLVRGETSVAEAARQDGWGHLTAVIDCHDRELIGYEFALRGQAKEAARAPDAACLARFGTVRPLAAPVLRSDNGLIFQSRQFRQACRDYRLP